jgi:asparagine synthase (glutamine-hydrolysing)
MGAVAGWLGRAAPGEAALVAPLEALAHRGTAEVYACRAESGQRLVLGHSYYDAESGIVVALDGPLANRRSLEAELAPRGYRFASGTPAETLARAYERWDKDVVQHLRGAFAFALWDEGRERLMLARDRFGEKPLYLCEQGGTLYFASQLKALQKMPGVASRVDTAALRDYLAYRYVPGPRTLLEGMRKLAPGSYALWHFGRLREQRYWVVPDQSNNLAGKPGPDPVGSFAGKLEEAVKLQEADGALLSGGLDSAALVALAAKHQGRLKTWSAGFADDPASELSRAAAVAKRFGTEHHEVVLSPRDVIARLPQVVAERDAPVSRPADVALHFLACEAGKTSRSVFTGEGADEVLGGYRRHVAEKHRLLAGAVPTLLLLAAPLAGRRPRLRRAIASLRTSDWKQRCVRWVGVEGNALLAAGSASLPSDFNGTSLRRALVFDQTSWLPDNVLERTDRMTAAASLEARAPFLDHRLAEFVSTLPDEMRVHGLAGKWILRRAAAPLLEGLAPRQAGFRIPVGAWLRGALADFLLEHLRGAGSRTRAYYDAALLDRLLDQHLAGRRNHEEILWTLLNFEIWHRAFRPA